VKLKKRFKVCVTPDKCRKRIYHNVLQMPTGMRRVASSQTARAPSGWAAFCSGVKPRRPPCYRKRSLLLPWLPSFITFYRSPNSFTTFGAWQSKNPSAFVLTCVLSEDLVRPERFELPTPCFVGKCSIQLSYGRKPNGPN
jgi:hypothetical protein